MQPPKKRRYTPIQWAYIELIMRRALQDRVSPAQYNIYSGTGILLEMYRFALFPRQANFYVFSGSTTFPVRWIPRTAEDMDFLYNMYQKYHSL